jgi:hypothetical protein
MIYIGNLCYRISIWNVFQDLGICLAFSPYNLKGSIIIAGISLLMRFLSFNFALLFEPYGFHVFTSSFHAHLGSCKVL